MHIFSLYQFKNLPTNQAKIITSLVFLVLRTIIYINYNLTYKVLILLLLHLDDLRRTVFNEHILYLFIDSTSSFV